MIFPAFSFQSIQKRVIRYTSLLTLVEACCSLRKDGKKDNPSPGGYSRSLPQKVAELQIPVTLTDTDTKDDQGATDSMKIHNLRSVMCVPLRAKDELLGILYLDSHAKNKQFEPANLTFLEGLAQLLSLGLYNAILYNQAIDRKEKMERANKDLRAMFDVSKNIISEMAC